VETGRGEKAMNEELKTKANELLLRLLDSVEYAAELVK
jgi:hypothetical protein